MTSGDTREFMALHAIATHYGRPGTPTDQAHIESLFGHLKHEWPHLCGLADPADLARELEAVRHQYNHVRLHAGIGYVDPHRRTLGPRRRDPPRPPHRACPRPRATDRLPPRHAPEADRMTATTTPPAAPLPASPAHQRSAAGRSRAARQGRVARAAQRCP